MGMSKGVSGFRRLEKQRGRRGGGGNQSSPGGSRGGGWDCAASGPAQRPGRAGVECGQGTEVAHGSAAPRPGTWWGGLSLCGGETASLSPQGRAEKAWDLAGCSGKQ